MRRTGLLALLISLFASAQEPPSMISVPLREQLATLSQSLAPGQPPVTPPMGGFMAWRRPYSYLVPMEAGRCYTILGIGGPGVVDLDLFLFDPGNLRVALDRHTNNWPRIAYCASFNGQYRVEAKVKRGAGEAAVRAYYASTTGAPAPLPVPVQPAVAAQPPAAVVVIPPPPPDAPEPVGDTLSLAVDAQAQVSAPGYARQSEIYRGVASSEGGRSDWYVQLEGGRCYNFIGAGGAGVRKLFLYLWEPSGRRVTDRRNPGPLTIMPYCAPFPGPYHLQAKVDDGAGEYRVGVYVK
jgi:hypothetical protein